MYVYNIYVYIHIYPALYIEQFCLCFNQKAIFPVTIFYDKLSMAGILEFAVLAKKCYIKYIHIYVHTHIHTYLPCIIYRTILLMDVHFARIMPESSLGWENGQVFFACLTAAVVSRRFEGV